MNQEDREDMQKILKEPLHLKLISPGVSPYSSPGFLVRNHGKIQGFPDTLKDKKQLQSFLGGFNFAKIFISILAHYRKVFSPLLKKDATFKWEDEHQEGIKQLKEVCKKLPKLPIP
ncbi:hypothetical protein DH2020_020241 [Rehmannia glutinosa]|uniref:Reverse transcriptase/retrotransposon-derived protein RNase H-like domain-containing protein n=1 Tax=Rehmannia glutinosa TaxID=99300 RepID=A0ABR0WFN8_REHGL